MIGGRTFEKILLDMIPGAKGIVAVGTCAAFGGIPSAEGNPTGSSGVRDFMNVHNLPCAANWSIAPVVRRIRCPSSDRLRIWRQAVTPK
jgi:Ni,Fe-hydrogenase I small subunit